MSQQRPEEDGLGQVKARFQLVVPTGTTSWNVLLVHEESRG